MWYIVLSGICSILWAFSAGVRLEEMISTWEDRKYNIVMFVTSCLCSIVFFLAQITFIIREIK